MGMSDFYRRLLERAGSSLLLVPAVAAIIRDQGGRVLVHQTQDDSWSLPAGAIEPGETPAQAVVREVEEETGLLVTPVRVTAVVGGPACRMRYQNGDEVEYVVTVFDCRVMGGQWQESGDETKALAYVDARELASRLAFPYPAAIFERAGDAALFW